VARVRCVAVELGQMSSLRAVRADRRWGGARPDPTRPDPLYAHDILVLLQRFLVHVTAVPTKCAVVDEAIHPTVPACDRQNVTTYETQR
jgi:hypothetical protein